MPPTRRSSRLGAAFVGALALIATLLALPAPAQATSEAEEPYAGYLFTYFTGEGTADGEQVYFALSRGNDPLRWQELNGGNPVLSSTLGDLGVRDPFVIRAPEGDRFYLIATDLRMHGDGDWDRAQRHGSRSIMVWESRDLVNWSAQRSVEVAPPTAGNVWAPEAYWDPEREAYVVFWASKLYAEDDPDHTGDTHNRMMYATTRDFTTFSEPAVWHDPGYSVIDSTVIEEDGVFHRFTKDERDPSSANPCAKFVTQESSTDLLDPAWDFVADCLGSGALARGEGPTVFRSNTEEKWYLFIDEFGGRGYVPFETTDLASGRWTESADYRLPASPRHGTVLPVTQAEYDRLAERWGVPPVRADEEGLVAHWPLDGSAADASGHGYDGTLAGDVSWADGALAFGGTDGHVRLPDDLLAGVDAVTVSADVWVDPAQRTPYFLFGLGNTAADGRGDGYLFATGGTEDGGFRAALSDGDWTREQQAASDGGLPRGRWVNVAYTIDGTSAVLYRDGVEVARNDAMTLRPSDIAGGRTTANYLGRSLYTADHRFTGRMRDVRLHNRALSADEIAALPGNATAVRAVDLRQLRVPAVIDTASDTVTLPVVPGTDRRRLRPEFTLAPGARISPPGGRPVDLREPVTYTVTSAEGATRRWTVRAVEMRSPVLPGYTADPNIVAFGDRYYLYATTDGFPGWGSTTFSAWSSRNLVDWRDEGVILDLGPDVSWADSRAWAPTIAERDGRYYFYYCADAKIGVAVADSPTGPFVDSGAPLIAANPDGGGQPIDPAVFTDTDGQPYLYWGNGSAWAVPLNDDMVSYDPNQVRRIEGLTDFREGLFVVERDGRYHLTYSIDDTRSPNYRVGYATSDSPLGPFTSRGVILRRDDSLGVLGTGHNSVLNVPGTDDWYIAYHRFAIPDGDGTHRETTLDRLTFSPDNLLKTVRPTLESVRPRRIE
ncbi:family 43 glycosylhydrolase [Streptomyces sp. NPDC127098]|uniref:family 43 glycosylhydrolase n=1 Tax=Streptomyces sp. NPDC127098 TaxID=3347137 RepID=UPI003661B7E6